MPKNLRFVYDLRGTSMVDAVIFQEVKSSKPDFLHLKNALDFLCSSLCVNARHGLDMKMGVSSFMLWTWRADILLYPRQSTCCCLAHTESGLVQVSL